MTTEIQPRLDEQAQADIARTLASVGEKSKPAQPAKPATLAERLYLAFVEELGWTDAPAFHNLEDKGEAWYRVVNARAELLQPAKTIPPYEYRLTQPKLEKVHPVTGREFEVTLADSTPTVFTIRPIVTRDLCQVEIDGERHYEQSIVASVLGIDFAKLDDIIDPIDADAMETAIWEATGVSLLTEVARVADFTVTGYPDKRLVEAYRAVTYALQIEDCGKYCMVDTRTLGKKKVGPYRLKHRRVWEDGRFEKDELSARIDALSHACATSVDDIMSAPHEDTRVLWEALERLKKKSDMASASLPSQRPVATSSASPSETSTTGPSTS